MIYQVVLLISVVSGIKTALLNKEEGEPCKFDGVEDWMCKTLINCPHIGDFRRSRPDLCGFQGKEPIICCPPVKTTTPQTVTTPISQDTTETDSYDNIVLLPGQASDVPLPDIKVMEVPNKPSAVPAAPPQKGPPASIMKCIEYEVTICKLVDIKDEPTVKVRRDVSKSPVKIDFNKLQIESKTANYDEFPFLVLIGFGEEPRISWECSGTIISQFWVLSAAHCSHSGGKKASVIGFGSTKMESKFSGFTIPISYVIVHPSYEPPAMYHDIALFNHNQRLGFGAFVHPACIYPLKVLPHKANTTVWGTTPQDKTLSRLQYLEMKTADPQKCEDIYNNSTLFPRGYDKEIMFCAGDTYLDSCSGESGAPLFYKSSVCLNVQIGIQSYGLPCGDYPGIFTKVSYYEPWIVQNVWPDYKFET